MRRIVFPVFIIALFSALLLSGGCAYICPEKMQKVFASKHQRTEADQILTYFRLVKKLPAAELEKESEAARISFEKTGSDFDRFRLVVLTLILEKSVTGEKTSLELLDAFFQQEIFREDSLAGLAELLHELLKVQEETRQRFLEEKERADILARQLKELREIEKILSDREMNDSSGK